MQQHDGDSDWLPAHTYYCELPAAGEDYAVHTLVYTCMMWPGRGKAAGCVCGGGVAANEGDGVVVVVGWWEVRRPHHSPPH